MQTEFLQWTTNLIGVVTGIVTVIIAVQAFYIYRKRFISTVEEAKKDVETRPKELEAKSAENEGIVTSPADKQYLLLREYHSQGLAQSKISFWFSLLFASLGFAVIIVAILTMDRNAQLSQQGRTFITLIAGTIIDAVSALFFVQSNKARQLMTEFFDKLRTDRKLEESLRLATQIPDPTLQSKLKILLALNFADVKSTDGILSSILNIDHQPSGANETAITKK